MILYLLSHLLHVEPSSSRVSDRLTMLNNNIHNIIVIIKINIYCLHVKSTTVHNKK